MKKKIDPKVYLKAAELIATGREHWACNAIATAVGLEAFILEWEDKRDDVAENLLFRDLFYDARRAACNLGWRHEGWWDNYDDEPRLIALCLAYHIAKDLNRQKARKSRFLPI